MKKFLAVAVLCATMAGVSACGDWAGVQRMTPVTGSAAASTSTSAAVGDISNLPGQVKESAVETPTDTPSPSSTPTPSETFAPYVSKDLTNADIATAMEQHDSLLAKIRGTLKISPDQWSQVTVGQAPQNCTVADAPDAVGKVRESTETWTGPLIVDGEWGTYVETVNLVAQEAGFGQYEILADQPGWHMVVWKDPLGAQLVFASQDRTSLYIKSGCQTP